MKKLLFTITLLLINIIAFAQTTHIVDNNANGIGDFDNINDAINAATAGDIILVVPSTTSYGNISLTSTGKRLTIAGGGMNGATGLFTQLGTVSLNGGSSNNTNLDGFVLGGFICESIDINFVDSVKVKAIRTSEVISNTNYQFRLRNSVGAEVEFIRTNNANFSADFGLKILHSDIRDNNNTIALEIGSCFQFLLSNSFIRTTTTNSVNTPTIDIDSESVGLVNNNVIIDAQGNGYRNMGFGGAIVNNNVLSARSNYIQISGGQLFQHNIVYAGNSTTYFNNLSPTLLTFEFDGQPDENGNFYSNSQVQFDTADDDLFLLPVDGSPVIDSGTGNDLDGSLADIGVFGGLDPMPTPSPNFAVGVSVVPSITNMKLSLPSAVTGGSVILNVTGQAKKN